MESPESAVSASCAVGVEILYGAFAFVRTCISGGWAIATPRLYDALLNVSL